MNQLAAIHDLRMQRIEDLFSWDVNLIDTTVDPRKYQWEILVHTVRDIQLWKTEWRWDIAVWGGKTLMALSLAHHVIQRWGRVLFLNPWVTELTNAVAAHRKYQLWDTNYCVMKGWEDINDLANQKFRRFFEWVWYYYSTVQMLTYEWRYRQFSPDFFDLVIVDESHGFLWDILSGPQRYFLAPQIHMSATPYNIQKHVGTMIPHVYGEISSFDLIRDYDFPKWIVKNYEIDESTDRYDGKDINGDFNFELDTSHNFLNTSQRFLILEDILEKIVLWERKAIWFMPSIIDCEVFVKYIAEKNPILQGKIDFVAGTRNWENKRVENRLRTWEIRVVLSKDLWNQAIDIPDVTDIILNDPTRSYARTIQRIWRWARPCKEIWKKTLYIHDIVSSLYHSSQVWQPAVRASELLETESEGNNMVYGQTRVIQAWDFSWDFLENLTALRESGISLSTSELWYSDKIGELYFFSDVSRAIDIFRFFARDVFHISYLELFNNFDIYSHRSHTLTILFQWWKYEISLAEAQSIAKYYWVFDTCREYDFISDLEWRIKEQQEMIETLPKRGETNSILWNEFQEDRDYISILNVFLQRYGKGGKVEFQEITWNWLECRVWLYGVEFISSWESWWGKSRQRCRHEVVYKLLKQIESLFSFYFFDQNNVSLVGGIVACVKEMQAESIIPSGKNPKNYLNEVLQKRRGRVIRWYDNDDWNVDTSTHKFTCWVEIEIHWEKYTIWWEKEGGTKKQGRDYASMKAVEFIAQLQIGNDKPYSNPWEQITQPKKMVRESVKWEDKTTATIVTIEMMKDSIWRDNYAADLLNRLRVGFWWLVAKVKYDMDSVNMIQAEISHRWLWKIYYAEIEKIEIDLEDQSKGKFRLCEILLEQLLEQSDIQKALRKMLRVG